MTPRWTEAEAKHLMALIHEQIYTSTPDEFGILLKYRAGTDHLRTGVEIRVGFEALHDSMRIRLEDNEGAGRSTDKMIADVLNKH